jgi:hypothetical protein
LEKRIHSIGRLEATFLWPGSMKNLILRYLEISLASPT